MSLFNRPKHIVRGNWSGVLLKGEKKLEVPSGMDHWMRAAVLTAYVETGGIFGSVMGYDGTGLTGSITQCVAVLPRSLGDKILSNDQGELWEIVELIHNQYPDITQKLYDEFDELGWELQDGRVSYRDGKLVPGAIIRNELSPPNGKVPSFGPQWEEAKGWAIIFSEIFSDSRTFPIQLNFAAKSFQDFTTSKRPQLGMKTVRELVYPVQDTLYLHQARPLDLALSVFLSFSVNAPAQALRYLGEIPHQILYDENQFPKLLIRKFKLSNYANWEERYKRTRSAAQKIWPTEFFKGPIAIMP